MNAQWDVLGLGCATVDDLLYVEQFPAPDVKTRVMRSERQGGGLTATALMAASRLGARCAYAAVLGHDEYSQFVAQNLRRENVDLSHVVWSDEARPIHSTIVVDTQHHTRNIFFDISGTVGAHDELPHEDVIRAARVLFLDHYGTTGGIRAARIARAAGNSVVADLERENVPRFDELLELVDHLIVSQTFAIRFTSTGCASEAALALWTKKREVVIVTGGAEGCWSLHTQNPSEPKHHAAFTVETVDTTGCGDVFHGAYAAALARGCDLDERVRFASAAAALKATQNGAQTGIPTCVQVEDFLRRD
jgi:sugar/nucleoside kinase (ribokinase family)